MKKKPRLVDIARLAGVSIGTVDRALHNRGRVAEDVRKRVLQVAADLGYKPNMLASTLAANKNFLLSLLLPDPSMDPFWEQVASGVRQAAEQVSHYGAEIDVTYFDLFDAADFEAKSSLLFQSKYHGALVAPVFMNEGRRVLSRLEHEGKPHVLINTLIESASDTQVCYIGPDSYQSGRLAARLLYLHLKEGDMVAMLPLEKDFKNAYHMLIKEQGFRDFFGDQPLDVVVETWDFEDFDDDAQLERFLTDKIQEYPQLAGIYSTASRIHKVAAFFEREDIHNVRLVGYDSVDRNLEFLERGVIDYLINQNPHLMGYLGVINLSKSLLTKKAPERIQYMPMDVILFENVKYYSKGYLFGQQIF